MLTSTVANQTAWCALEYQITALVPTGLGKHPWHSFRPGWESTLGIRPDRAGKAPLASGAALECHSEARLGSTLMITFSDTQHHEDGDPRHDDDGDTRHDNDGDARHYNDGYTRR